MIEGAIFDLDGTLLDSMMIWDNIAENYLKSIGLSPTAELRIKVNNMSLLQAAEFVQKEYSLPLSVSEITDGINKTAEHYYREVVELKPGVLNLLDHLFDNNVKMCIATASDKYLVEMVLERCGITKYFSKIFTCTQEGGGKNEPYIYRKALEFLKTPKDKTIIFEDALYAIKTAKNDDFFVAAIYDEYEKDPQEVEKISDIVISDYNDLDGFFKIIDKI